MASWATQYIFLVKRYLSFDLYGSRAAVCEILTVSTKLALTWETPSSMEQSYSQYLKCPGAMMSRKLGEGAQSTWLPLQMDLEVYR